MSSEILYKNGRAHLKNEEYGFALQDLTNYVNSTPNHMANTPNLIFLAKNQFPSTESFHKTGILVSKTPPSFVRCTYAQIKTFSILIDFLYSKDYTPKYLKQIWVDRYELYVPDDFCAKIHRVLLDSIEKPNYIHYVVGACLQLITYYKKSESPIANDAIDFYIKCYVENMNRIFKEQQFNEFSDKTNLTSDFIELNKVDTTVSISSLHEDGKQLLIREYKSSWQYKSAKFYEEYFKQNQVPSQQSKPTEKLYFTHQIVTGTNDWKVWCNPNIIFCNAAKLPHVSLIPTSKNEPTDHASRCLIWLLNHKISTVAVAKEIASVAPDLLKNDKVKNYILNTVFGYSIGQENVDFLKRLYGDDNRIYCCEQLTSIADMMAVLKENQSNAENDVRNGAYLNQGETIPERRAKWDKKTSDIKTGITQIEQVKSIFRRMFSESDNVKLIQNLDFDIDMLYKYLDKMNEYIEGEKFLLKYKIEEYEKEEKKRQRKENLKRAFRSFSKGDKK